MRSRSFLGDVRICDCSLLTWFYKDASIKNFNNNSILESVNDTNQKKSYRNDNSWSDLNIAINMEWYPASL